MHVCMDHLKKTCSNAKQFVSDMGLKWERIIRPTYY